MYQNSLVSLLLT